MTDIYINSVTFFAEFLITMAILLNGYSFKKNIVKSALWGLLAYAVALLIYFLFSNIYLNIATTFVINLFFSYFSFKTTIKESIINSVLITALMIISEFICLSVSSRFIDVNIYDTDLNFFILFTAFSKIIYLVLGIILIHFTKARKNPTTDYKTKTPIYLFIYPVCMIFVMVVYWIMLSHDSISNTSKTYISVSVILISFAVIITYIFYAYTEKRNFEIHSLQTELNKFEAEEAYYKLLDYQTENIKRLAHDEKNHLLMVKSLANNPDVDAYVDKIYTDLQKYTPKNLTNNKQLDVLLNKYTIQCEAEHIDFVSNIRTANLSFMENSDLVSLLSNILDNAVESAIHSDKRAIELSINIAMGTTVITCVNSCDNAPKDINGKLETSKSNKSFHGFGTKIIKQIVNKYGGEYTWHYENDKNEFVSVIAFTK